MVLRQISSKQLEHDQTEKLSFTCAAADLFIWVSGKNEVTRFQLSYAKPNSEKSLIWERHSGLEYAAVENGSRPGKHPAAPILLDEVPLNENELLKLLNQQGGEFPESYLRFIQDRICDHMDATLKN